MKEKNGENNLGKQGISLIVLVITIIVLAILAAAVIISISNTNIMQKATTATFEADMQELKSKYSIWLADYILENEEYDINEINYDTGDSYLLNTILGGQVPEKYKAELKVVKGKLVYGEEDSGAVTNPHEGEEWVCAWAYNPTDGWGDKLTAGDTIPANATITAKIYANGETVTPKIYSYGTKVTLVEELTEGDAYDMVIEGTGEMGKLVDMDNSEEYAWMAEDDTQPVPIAFYITKVIITDGVTNIGDNAFYYCTSLTSVTIPDSVTNIGEWAFACTSLTSVIIPDGVTSIGKYAFYCCASLTSVTIPNSVINIGEGAFYYCASLTSVTIPNSVTSIGNMAFHNCTSLSSATIGNGVTSIGYMVFGECRSLSEVAMGSGVTSIETHAFVECTSLTAITIPDSVTSISEDAFTNVPHIYYNGSATGSPWGALAIN